MPNAAAEEAGDPDAIPGPAQPPASPSGAPPAPGAARWRRRLLRGVLYLFLILHALGAITSTMVTDIPRSGRSFDPALYGLPFEPLSIVSGDGVSLDAWYVPAEGDGPGVVLCHGILDEKSGQLEKAAWLRSVGSPVVLFDFRAHGRSGGGACTLGAKEALDVVAAAQALRARLGPGRPIAAWGFSMGGSSALLAAGRSREIAGVIADSAFDTFPSTLNTHARELFGAPGRLLVPFTIFWAEVRGGFDADDADAVAAVRRMGDRPILLVRPERDRLVPMAMQERIAAAHPGPHEIWEVAGADHVLAWDHATGAYQEKVREFLRRLR